MPIPQDGIVPPPSGKERGILHGNSQWKHAAAYAEAMGENPYDSWGLAFGMVPIIPTANDPTPRMEDQKEIKLEGPRDNSFTNGAGPYKPHDPYPARPGAR